MTGRAVVELVKQNIGVPWRDQSYRDTFKFGDPDSPIKGIATTMMVTFGMLKRANEAGLNMVIAHEPTFWNDRDETKDLLNDPLYQAKTRYMRENGMVVWRMHDHMHSMQPDYTVVGSLRSVGVKGGENAGMRPGVLPIPETTLGAFASQAKRFSGARAVRCVGDPKAKVSKVLLGPGYATPRMTSDTDIVVGGEQQEADGLFDNVQYVADAASLGIPKAWLCWDTWCRNRRAWKIWAGGCRLSSKGFRSSSSLLTNRIGRRRPRPGVRQRNGPRLDSIGSAPNHSCNIVRRIL